MDIETSGKFKWRHGWAFPPFDEYISERITPDGLYQIEALERGLELLRERHSAGRRFLGAAIDGGAHVGTWTVPLLERFARVLSFEPAVDTFACLQRNVENHGPDRAGTMLPAELHQEALGASPGRVHMALGDKYRKMGHSGARYAVEDPVRGTIRRVTIDSLKLPALDFLKLDLEGGEYDALVGGALTIQEYHPVLVIEAKKFGKRYGHEPAAPFDLLTAWGAHQLDKVGINAIWGW